MKRSEILQHIREDLEDKREMLNRGKFDYVAGEILDMLEGFGMLPPFKYDPRDKEANSVCKQAKFYAKWEPEDG